MPVKRLVTQVFLRAIIADAMATALVENGVVGWHGPDYSLEESAKNRANDMWEQLEPLTWDNIIGAGG